jgi:beta-N-acetylhexosaminidase
MSWSIWLRGKTQGGQIGGVMYLRPNIESLAQVRAMNQTFRAARPWLPPLIALDQEGGQIRRLTEAVGFAEIPSAHSIGQGSVANALAVYGDLAERLAALGFNVNFGPVVDLDLNPDNPIIARYERSFGVDPVRVVQMAEAFVEAHRAAGMGTSLKHFPGHGSSTGDTHDGFVDVTDVWQDVELEPYREMIGNGLADMVMVAHIFNADVANGSDVQLPASLSPEWIEGVLRSDLGFEGVVISDDMEMGAVREQFDLRETVVRAVMAGNDIVLFSNTAEYDPELGATVHAVLVEEARADPAFAARIAESYQRILAYKAAIAERAQ